MYACEALPDLLKQVQDAIEQVTDDGAYDTHGAYEATRFFRYVI